MKIYLNKNCSGYHWFEGTISGTDEIISMNYAKPVPESMPILKGLMLHSQYEACMVQENGMYILSLNNIPEHKRTDEFGRPISLQIVFLNKDVEPLWKILFNRLQYYKEFSDLLSKCFVSVIASDPQYVRCKKSLIDELLDSCYTKSFSDKASEFVNKNHRRLLYINNGSRTVMTNIGFSEDEILNAECCGTNNVEWLIDNTSEPIDIVEQLKKDLQDAKLREEELKSKLATSEEELENVKSDIEALREELKDFKRGKTPVSVDDKRIKQLEKDLQDAKSREETLKVQLASSRKELEDVKSNIESLRKRLEELTNLFALKNRELMRFKLTSIVLGISSTLLLLLYFIK